MVNERETIGDFEAIVLMATVQLGANAYGSRVHQQIEHDAGRSCSSGALYATISRLEKKGYLLTRLGEPTAVRGGRAKTFLRVSESGKFALRQFYASLHRLADGISDLALSGDVYKILSLHSASSLTSREVFSMLGKLGWLGEDSSASMDAIHSALRDLSDQGLVRGAKKSGEPAWQALVFAKGTLGDIRTERVERGGFIEEG